MNETKLRLAADQYDTPFYVFDTDLLAKQIRYIRAALPPGVRLCYAMKANPFLTKALEPLVDCLEVCSPGEFRICRRAGVPPDKIVLSGVYKRQSDIEDALRIGSGVFTVESLSQWQMLVRYAEEYARPIRVLLRLTAGNQFGMEEGLLRDIVAGCQAHSFVKIEGIQYFSGTQKKSAGKYEKELTVLDNLCAALKAEHGFETETLEYGPGLPACYFPEEDTVEEVMLSALAEQLGKLRFRGTVTLEMGRYIAASCGYYVTRVVDSKRHHGQAYCIVDGGIHQINYFGQMMAMKKPPILHLNQREGKWCEWTVCGALCTTNDVLVKQYPFCELHLGDTLVFGKTGAYSVTEGISLFLSRDLPQVVFYSEQNGFCLAREAFRTDCLNYFPMEATSFN